MFSRQYVVVVTNTDMTEQLPSQELIDFIGLHQSAEEMNIFPGSNQLNYQLNHQADTKK